MSVRLMLLMCVALILPTACSTIPPLDSLSPDQDYVTYKTFGGPYCGACHTTTLIVAYDGQVWIEQGYWAGHYRNWRTFRRKVQVSKEVLAQFLERLEAYRPTGDVMLTSSPPCVSYINHSDGVRIKWQIDGDESELNFEFGCDFEFRAEMRKALKTAPALLEIPNFSMPEFE